MKARFITLEGIDGAGKSSHLQFIHAWLNEHAIDTVMTREPGGTPLGEDLRKLLLSTETKVSLETETLLMFAARQQHIDSVIQPALNAGKWVVSDRFTDATYAYQGGGRGLALDQIAVLEKWVQKGLQPDLTFIFDVSVDVAAKRMGETRVLDRFEQEKADFHQRVRETYLKRAKQDNRFIVLDSSETIETIQAKIRPHLQALLETD